MGKEQTPRSKPNSQREQDRKVREYNMINDLRFKLGIGGTITPEQYDEINHQSYHNDPIYIAETKKAEEAAKAKAITDTHNEMDKKLDEQR